MVIKWLPNSCCGTGRAVQTPIRRRRAEVRRLPSSKWTKTHWYGAMIASTLYLASITYTYILKASQLTAQLVSLLRSNRILPCTIPCIPMTFQVPVFVRFLIFTVRRLGRRPETAERHSSSAVRCTGIGGDKSNWAVNKFDSMISIISFATQFFIVLVEIFSVLIGNISSHLFSIVRKLWMQNLR